MKKILLFSLVLFCGFGCSFSSKTPSITTYQKMEGSLTFDVQYPITTYRKLDQNISKDVSSFMKSFQKEYGTSGRSVNASLVISYSSFVANVKGLSYINVILKEEIYCSVLAHPIHKIKTYVYDSKKKSILTFYDFIPKKKLERFVPFIQQQLIHKYKDCILTDSLSYKTEPVKGNYELFSIEDKAVVLFFNPYEVTAGYCGIVSISIPFSILNE